MKCTFGMKINNKVFYKLILSFCVCVTRYTQSTQNKFAISSLQIVSITLGNLAKYAQSAQNNKFTISLQYHKENMKDEVDFLTVINLKCFFIVILSF